MKNYNLAVVGATGNVGREILNILEQRSFPIKKIHALASKKSEGTKISYVNDKEITVEDLDKFNFKSVVIVLSSPGSNVSKKFVPISTKARSIVIDNNSTDNTKDFIRSKLYNIKFIESNINLGFSKANNQAVKSAKGEYLFFLNPDTVIPENLFDSFFRGENDLNNLGIYRDEALKIFDKTGWK